MPQYEVIHFQRREDGVYLVGRWPRLTRMTAQMLGTAEILSVTDEGHLAFATQNGSATYRLARQQSGGGVICLERVSYSGGVP